jgi:hypothetical protein
VVGAKASKSYIPVIVFVAAEDTVNHNSIYPDPILEFPLDFPRGV